MAPPSNRPRLRDVDPDGVGREAVRAWVNRVCDVVEQGDPSFGVAIHNTNDARFWTENWQECQLGRTAHALAEYAASGGEPDQPVAETIATVSIGTGVEHSDYREPECMIGLVCLAASARDRLRRGQPLTLAQLACLGSLAYGSVRNQGLKTNKAGEVTVRRARAWLSQRVNQPSP